MKLDEFIHLKEICPKRNNTLMVHKKSWRDMSGALYYVFCVPCRCRGNGANDKETALEKFHKELARKEKLALRKPEKILTDIRDYLVTEKGRVSNSDIYLLQIQAVEKFADKALAYLTEYAEKLGVEL
jgi:hypothetical protein